MAGSEDKKAYIWDLQTREIVQILEGHTGASDEHQPSTLYSFRLSRHGSDRRSKCFSSLFLSPLNATSDASFTQHDRHGCNRIGLLDTNMGRSWQPSITFHAHLVLKIVRNVILKYVYVTRCMNPESKFVCSVLLFI